MPDSNMMRRRWPFSTVSLLALSVATRRAYACCNTSSGITTCTGDVFPYTKPLDATGNNQTRQFNFSNPTANATNGGASGGNGGFSSLTLNSGDLSDVLVQSSGGLGVDGGSGVSGTGNGSGGRGGEGRTAGDATANFAVSAPVTLTTSSLQIPSFGGLGGKGARGGSGSGKATGGRGGHGGVGGDVRLTFQNASTVKKTGLSGDLIIARSVGGDGGNGGNASGSLNSSSAGCGGDGSAASSVLVDASAPLTINRTLSNTDAIEAFSDGGSDGGDVTVSIAAGWRAPIGWSDLIVSA